MLQQQEWKKTSICVPVETGNYAIMYRKFGFDGEEYPLVQGFGFFLTVPDSHEVGFHSYPIAAKELQAETGWIDTYDDCGDLLEAEYIVAFLGPIVVPPYIED